MYKGKYSGGFRNFKHFGKRPQKKRVGFRSDINQSFYVKKAAEFTKIEEGVTIHQFNDFGFEPQLVENIKAKGYVKPTEIQDKVIPHIRQNQDVLGIANTGTGKTAAYILPLINKILLNPNERVIILAPTRELAIQIKEELRSFTWGMNVYVALAIGGAFIREQIIKIRRGPHVIIGTPGRIMDLGKRRVIDFGSLSTVVLDEVDRMLDMGFIGDIKAIVDQTPKGRQTLFFSATLDKKVEPLANAFLNNPIKVSTKIQDSSSHVEQNIVRVPRQQKEAKLHQLVAQPDFKKVLVFGSTQMIVDKLSANLIQNGFKAQGLHGGKRQHQRQQIVRNFRENQITILVATDVAARGLDIADITHVINYDEPNNYDDYVHRIGRTGRGNSKGFALTFVE
ncbi:DEAD/DEAH box helicase [Patescibacteria group bacterium]|nr:DEAD/DEAH box helicase [Patescibacteria group bacterium]